MSQTSQPRVVIVGGGFGGLYTAQALRKAPAAVTLIDRRNFHLFQPLLYQVATGGLSPEDIASPLRGVLKRQKNTRVLTGKVTDLDPARGVVRLEDGDEVGYDTLVVATGSGHHYFGRDDEWSALAPGLKTIEDAITIRRRVLLAFEAAEREADPDRRRALLTFVIIGGGPTGVELAGALGDLARHTLPGEFRNFDPAETTLLLVEGLDRILTGFPPGLSQAAARSLAALGVQVRTGAMVTDIAADHVVVRDAAGSETRIPTFTVLWGAGVRASSLGAVVAQRTGAEQDRAGRLVVGPDLSLPGHANIFVIGDLAHYEQDGAPLPGVAQVAMQQGQYVADVLRRRRAAQPVPPFRYKDKGVLAVIGRHEAVADIGRLHFSGLPAWLIWVFVHINFLIEFDNKLKVMTQWGWNYVTRRQGARLITGEGEPVWRQLPLAQPAPVPVDPVP
ncbi:MAG: NAD(P)/FAD-dependent oxidoreductase [Candidatus Promineofilum sp.]|nr:NAD(P)/FAD-dependent oxidoreductase [Promineifilum sp.]